MDKIKGFEPAEGIREQLQCNVVMGIHSLNWASMLLDLAKATGDEKLRQRADQTANYITYYLQPDNRIVVGFQYNQWWYSCHAGVICTCSISPARMDHDPRMTDLPYHRRLDAEVRDLARAAREVVRALARGSGLEHRAVAARLRPDLLFLRRERLLRSGDQRVRRSPYSGERAVPRGGDVFSASHDPAKPHTSLSACLSLSRDDTANVLLRHAYPRHCRLKDRKSYQKMFAAVLTLCNRKAGGAISTPPARSSSGSRSWRSRPPGTRRGGGETGAVDHVLTAQGWIQMLSATTSPSWIGRVPRAQRGLLRPPVQGAHRHVAEGMAHRGAAPARHPPAGRSGGHGQKPPDFCGFDCPFHFSRTFKRRFGVPPCQLPPRPPGARVCGSMRPAPSCFSHSETVKSSLQSWI